MRRPASGSPPTASAYNGLGQREPTGNYQVLIVASNVNCSGTAETPPTASVVTGRGSTR
jgi:hypothetical protein